MFSPYFCEDFFMLFSKDVCHISSLPVLHVRWCVSVDMNFSFSLFIKVTSTETLKRKVHDLCADLCKRQIFTHLLLLTMTTEVMRKAVSHNELQTSLIISHNEKDCTRLFSLRDKNETFSIQSLKPY